MSTNYAVSLEACHILTRERAEEIAEIIRERFSNIDEDMYVCISEYERVHQGSIPREEQRICI